MIPRILEPEVMDTPEEAAAYDAMDHSGPNEAFVQRLIELGAGGKMLDIGTGPGHIPLMLAERTTTAHIIGIDLSREMLGLAEKKRAASPVGNRVEFQLADAKGLSFADDEFGTIFSNTILHHIPDPRSFLLEADRVVKKGGVLLIRDLFRPESVERINELVALHAAEADEHGKQLFAASLHAALTPAELEAMAWEIGLRDFEVVIDTDRHMSLQRKRHPYVLL
jgi:ubiquinone/menaquinone biosynthesis C-methylase UbiE